MRKMLLLIDANQTSRSNLATYLTTLGYKVAQSDSFKAGMDYLNMTHVSMVLVDSQLPEAEVGANRIKYRFGLKSLLVASNEKYSRAQAMQFGYVQSISYPYSETEITNFIDGVVKLNLSSNPADKIQALEALDDSQQTFCGAFIDDFFKNPVVRFDLFYKLNDHKYIKINRAGDPVNDDLLKKLKNNNIDKVYLRKEDYKKYVSINIEKISESPDNPQKAREEKMEFLVATSGLILQNVLVDGIDKDFFMMGKQVTDTAIELISDNDYLYQLLHSLNQTNEDIFRHSLGMSVYSVLMAKALGWTAPSTHFKLSIASLYADISLRQMDPMLLSKPKMLYSHMEMREYQEHSSKSAEIIRSLEGIPEDIYQIILNIHENMDGSGFPNRLSNRNIHPLSKLIRVADEFCGLVLKSKDNRNVLPPKSAIEHMEKHSMKKIDEDAMKALKLLFADHLFKKVA